MKFIIFGKLYAYIDMNRKFLSIAAVACSLLFMCGRAYAQMTDEAILSYIAEGVAAGKTNSQIGNELLAKGVTVTQAKRLIQAYKADGGANSFSSAKMSSQLDQTRTGRKQIEQNLTVRSERNVVVDDQEGVTDQEQTGADSAGQKTSKDADKTDLKSKKTAKKVIYGHDLFKTRNLSFEPNQNLATPGSYILGPGDEVIVDVWGVNEATIRQTITSDGKIYISQVGPVELSGLSIDAATAKLKKVLSSKYSLGGANSASKISVSLGNVRSIQVHIMGEVKVPGTYRLSSLSTVFHALYLANGVSDLGSLRNIRISRDGKVVSTSDIYSFLFEGTDGGNVSLKDGDIIMVPPYESLVEVSGGVKRPMYYEVKEGESLQSVLNYAGGLVSNAHTEEVTVERKNAAEGSVFTVQAAQLDSFGVQDGDIVYVYTNKQEDVYKNRIEIKGSVVRPGVYALGGDIATVRQLVEHAGGLLEDAFTSRAQIIREKADRSLEIQAVAIGAIMDGTSEDITLRKNDVVIISNSTEIDVKGDLTINGFVMNPGDYQFADNMTVEDLILLAGGLSDGATSARVDVSRRIVDFKSEQASETLAEVFSFTIADGLMVEGTPNFILKPYDIVSVRRSPTYKEQCNVRVSGEATFPGEYTLQSNKERLSDIFKRMGGATPNGYIEGAMLRRKVSEDERNVRRNMVNMVKRGGNRKDSTLVNKLKINETYTIGINLEEALKRPGSDSDVVLHDGDELIIPSITNTVRIQGEVMYPNAVNYLPGKNVKYYIKQAGGFSNEAKRAKVYVVYMNGKVSVGSTAKIIPGCEVIVPSRPERQKTTIGEWIGIGTAAASVATMAATIANLVK